MILLGITGAIGHGKSTFAETLHMQEPGMLHLETNMPIIDIADALQARLITERIEATPAFAHSLLQALPATIEDLLHRDAAAEDIVPGIDAIINQPQTYAKLLEYLQLAVDQPGIVGEHITAANKELYRPLLQWIGAYLIERIDPLIWIAEVIERARDYEASGGPLAVIGGIRSNVEAQVVQEGQGKVILIKRPGIQEPDLADPTERHRAHITPDATVINNGAVTDLLDVAQRVLDDLRLGQLKTEYDALGGPGKANVSTN